MRFLGGFEVNAFFISVFHKPFWGLELAGEFSILISSLCDVISSWFLIERAYFSKRFDYFL
jgi:hypothetical protein